VELMRVLRSRDRDRACCYDLSATQCHALQALVRRGPLTVNDLAAHLYLEKSTASRLAATLLDKELVRKRASRSDGRVVVLQVTEAGQRLSRRILNDLTVEYMELLKQIDPELRSALPHLLERLTSVVARRSGGARPCGPATAPSPAPGAPGADAAAGMGAREAVGLAATSSPSVRP
jgi:MarR family transcriptional regulator, 2-MHQ and catechol-resistance regulon repressor